MLTELQKRHRELLRKSFYAYIQWAWPLVDPAKFIPNWHIARMCEYLEAMRDGEISKLLINVPPGHQKSLTVNVFFQSWDWIDFPQHRFMFTSNRGDLALRDADRTRNLIRTPEYQQYFGDRFQLRKGQDTKHRYENDKKGYRFSTPMSGIMGEGGDFCFKLEELVLTNRGYKPIITLDKNDVVLSFDITDQVYEWQKVESTVFIEKQPLLEIETNYGKFQSTPNHVWPTADGYKRTHQLREGEALYRFKGGLHEVRQESEAEHAMSAMSDAFLSAASTLEGVEQDSNPCIVKAVRKVAGLHDVACINVRKNHNFVLKNGVVTHNCILDDPHNVEQAESDEVRDETVRKINLALPTRVRSKKGGTCVIMQRLHEKDYSGQALREDGWVHLCLPAAYEHDHPHVSRTITLPSGRVLKGDDREVPGVIEAIDVLKNRIKRMKDQDKIRENRLKIKILADKYNGELLFPELFSQDRVDKLKETMGTYGAAGQLQQRPTAREGGLFKRSWFDENYINPEELPKRRIVVRAWDLAGSTRKTSPYTAGIKMSWARGRFYIERADRERATPAEMERFLKSIAVGDGKRVYIDLPQDPGQAGKHQVQTLVRLLSGFAVKWSPESGDKVSRAEPFSAQCEAGNVYIVKGDWNDDYISELVLFPGSDFKDQVDASSRAFMRLIELAGIVNTGVYSGGY